MRRLRFAVPILVATVSLGAATMAAGVERLAATYSGKAKGVKASVIVDELGDGKLRYRLRSDCGTSKGGVALDGSGTALRGRRETKRSLLVVKFKGGSTPAAMSGTLKYTVDGEDGKCRNRATVAVAANLAASPEVKSLAGHYSGAGEDGGHPISFDVAWDRRSDSLEIRDMAFATDTECWEDLDDDGLEDTLVAQISGLAGEVSLTDGSFEIDHSPDEDTAFYVEGYLEDGEAVMDLEVGGFFALDGTPLSGGPLECDSWGETYVATRG